jgi:CDP-diacylglycerol--glycerol-3-phosphate 3-phosphatidyltransferase
MASAFRRNLPNTLTILRLVLAAAFFGSLNAYQYPDQHVAWANLAVFLFILAAITDALDGYLARRWEVISQFGRLMDPFCDKVLVLGAFIYLAGPRFVIPGGIDMATGIYPWMVVVILARELLVTGIRGVIESMGIEFGAKWSGKWKMILQSIVIPIVLVLTVNFQTGETPWAMWTCHVLVYLTLAVTAYSGWPYVLALRDVIRAGKGDASS